jgi:hypothetical protein
METAPIGIVSVSFQNKVKSDQISYNSGLNHKATGALYSKA